MTLTADGLLSYRMCDKNYIVIINHSFNGCLQKTQYCNSCAIDKYDIRWKSMLVWNLEYNTIIVPS